MSRKVVQESFKWVIWSWTWKVSC